MSVTAISRLDWQNCCRITPERYVARRHFLGLLLSMEADMRITFMEPGAVLLAMAIWFPAAFAQVPADTEESGSLILWTQMEQPQPIQAKQQSPQPHRGYEDQSEDVQRQPASQTFTGTIMKDGNQYVLKTADNITYQLDDQDRARKFDDKQVEIMGILNTATNRIQVRDIKASS